MLVIHDTYTQTKQAHSANVIKLNMQTQRVIQFGQEHQITVQQWPRQYATMSRIERVAVYGNDNCYQNAGI